METMHREFQGDCTYHAESDIHMPHLTVSETISLPAKARSSRKLVASDSNSSQDKTPSHIAERVNNVLESLNLRDAASTKIGSAFVPGVSGGERKRASIAEIMLCESRYQCWDNSTRGLDSANAIDFLKTLRTYTRENGTVAIVTLYQASQEMYDVSLFTSCMDDIPNLLIFQMFDKVCLFYKGYQIYFGEASAASQYFKDMGYMPSERATTGDFLTSITNPAARVIRLGFDLQVPRTTLEFRNVWRTSPQFKCLMQQISEYNRRFPYDGLELEKYRSVRKSVKSAYL
jgi:ATP-binding cassette, subfamily G (WHITE), member 2, PDR